MSALTYPEAIGVGLLQGVTELFPVSSLGHSILLPALLGGHWKQDLNVSAEGSPYLSVLIGLHLATALALIVYFWKDWRRIIRGLFTSITQRRIETGQRIVQHQARHHRSPFRSKPAHAIRARIYSRNAENGNPLPPETRDCQGFVHMR